MSIEIDIFGFMYTSRDCHVIYTFLFVIKFSLFCCAVVVKRRIEERISNKSEKGFNSIW